MSGNLFRDYVRVTKLVSLSWAPTQLAGQVSIAQSVATLAIATLVVIATIYTIYRLPTNSLIEYKACPKKSF